MKKLIILLSLLLLFSNSFGVELVSAPPVQTNNASSTTTDLIVGMIGVVIVGGILIAIITVIIAWINNKIQEAKRRHQDLLYAKFLVEVDKCSQNRDSRLKKKRWWTMFIVWKRSHIYLNTKEEGLKLFGNYDGEVIIKDNFLLISVHRRKSIWKVERDIIIIPYELRKIVHKEFVSKKWNLMIDCESIDEALNTDYYNTVVIKDHKDDDKLINFNEYIQNKFMDKYIYRQVIKDNLLNYKDSMDEAVEINPNVQVGRKNPNN